MKRGLPLVATENKKNTTTNFAANAKQRTTKSVVTLSKQQLRKK